jgi:hypothetical protein
VREGSAYRDIWSHVTGEVKKLHNEKRHHLYSLPNMALGSTQPLTEMSTRNLPGGKGRPARKADNLTAICEPTV